LPPLAAGERVLAWARLGAGSAVVATNLGLFLPGSGARLGWHEIHKATWDGKELTVVAAGLVERREEYAVVANLPPVSVVPADPGDLPQVVRTRVTRSVALSSHHRVPGGGVRVVARRVPGVDGLAWTVRYDDATGRRGPGVAEATAELVARHAAAQPRAP
jgi:hypothetical protein